MGVIGRGHKYTVKREFISTREQFAQVAECAGIKWILWIALFGAVECPLIDIAQRNHIGTGRDEIAEIVCAATAAADDRDSRCLACVIFVSSRCVCIV
jgi:hypothetical protein